MKVKKRKVTYNSERKLYYGSAIIKYNGENHPVSTGGFTKRSQADEMLKKGIDQMKFLLTKNPNQDDKSDNKS